MSGQPSGIPVGRPPTAMYEVRTRDGMAYRAEGDVIEHGDGWFTLWSDEWTVALKIPDQDIRAIRQVPDGEECEALPACICDADKRSNCPVCGEPELTEVEALRVRLHAAEEGREEARQWARHGYEIGQRHCGWADHGVAPAWLTEGWPPHIDTCQHLRGMATLDEAVARVRALAEQWQAAMRPGEQHPAARALLAALDGDTDTSKEQR